MIYEVKGYQKYTGYNKVYFSVEAESPEEALKLVKKDPDSFYQQSDNIDYDDYEYTDLAEWEVE